MISGLVSPGSSQIHYFRRITLKRFHMTQRFLCTCQSQGGLSSTIWLQVDFLSPFQSPFPSSEYWLVPISAVFPSMTFSLSILTESNKFDFVKTVIRNCLRQDYMRSLRLKGLSTPPPHSYCTIPQTHATKMHFLASLKHFVYTVTVEKNSLILTFFITNLFSYNCKRSRTYSSKYIMEDKL